MARSGALLCGLLLLVSLLFAKADNDAANNDHQSSSGGFPSQGGSGYWNWRYVTENTLNVHNVGSVKQLWNYTIPSDAGFNAVTKGGFSATPTSIGDEYLYAPTWNGVLLALNRLTGHTLWSFNISAFLLSKIGSANLNEYTSRASPTIDGNTLYITTRAGAYVIALNRLEGTVLWSKQIDKSPRAWITTGVRSYGSLVYTGVASNLESALPGLDPWGFQGRVVALNKHNGALVWNTPMAPNDTYYGGPSVWGSLAPIDVARNQIFFGTGNLAYAPQDVQNCMAIRFNYSDSFFVDPCRKPGDFSQSIVALDLDTGAVQWVRNSANLVALWTPYCGTFLGGVEVAPNTCPDYWLSQDYDFGTAPIFIPGGSSTPDGKDTLIACQKSGLCYAISAQAGYPHWIKQLAPGGDDGGFEFGSIATDGTTLYYADTNSDGANFTLQNGQVINYAHFGALNIASGRILWETPLPVGHPGPGILQGIILANGVVYASTVAMVDDTPSTAYGGFGPENSGGHFYALNAATGAILLDLKLDPKACYSPSVINGVLYVACGYNAGSGLFSVGGSLYALALHPTTAPAHHQAF